MNSHDHVRCSVQRGLSIIILSPQWCSPSGVVEALPLSREAWVQFPAGELGSHQISPNSVRARNLMRSQLRWGLPLVPDPSQSWRFREVYARKSRGLVGLHAQDGQRQTLKQNQGPRATLSNSIQLLSLASTFIPKDLMSIDISLQRQNDRRRVLSDEDDRMNTLRAVDSPPGS